MQAEVLADHQGRHLNMCFQMLGLNQQQVRQHLLGKHHLLNCIPMGNQVQGRNKLHKILIGRSWTRARVRLIALSLP